MKKNLIAVAFAATAALSMSNAFAAAGTVNFTGEILNDACIVDVASQNQTVDLGSYHKAEFVRAGDSTSAKKFSIVLKNCPATVSTARVRFDGTPEATDSSLLAIDSTTIGAATGVAINLMSADKSQLPLHGDNNYRYALNTTADNILNFYAQYKSTVDNVTAGPANAATSFSVVYN
ncbi:fimbrial protein [Lelliottia sp. V89_10]|uniref:fimbrial protein n=1 Tax=Lelliottia wanjuensis TaxID=3050585 RepID=UPI00249F6E7C|nr:MULTISPECIES: fimbrial protein [unclassified Lelliottia]MDI3359181.1 fimbrial protein [Lelliottia sp. V89_13]MDK9550878.1 fimbrial protein [Lelliottia sp. V89_5]MDK9598363.1 fimbrial protein [Lelliottia sp. V89_10]